MAASPATRSLCDATKSFGRFRSLDRGLHALAPAHTRRKEWRRRSEGGWGRSATFMLGIGLVGLAAVPEDKEGVPQPSTTVPAQGRVKRVAVIGMLPLWVVGGGAACSQLMLRMAGAGASGLISAKCLLDEGFEVTVYEQEPHLGGLWRYGDSTDGTSLRPYCFPLHRSGLIAAACRAQRMLPIAAYAFHQTHDFLPRPSHRRVDEQEGDQVACREAQGVRESVGSSLPDIRLS